MDDKKTNRIVVNKRLITFKELIVISAYPACITNVLLVFVMMPVALLFNFNSILNDSIELPIEKIIYYYPRFICLCWSVSIIHTLIFKRHKFNIVFNDDNKGNHDVI